MHEQISVFDIFKIWVGPSSSHTLGPWRAAQRFVQLLKASNVIPDIQHLKVLLYGSLAKTGKGHGTNIAVAHGLAGHDPVSMDTSSIDSIIDNIRTSESLLLNDDYRALFNFEKDIHFLLSDSCETYLGIHAIPTR